MTSCLWKYSFSGNKPTLLAWCWGKPKLT